MAILRDRIAREKLEPNDLLFKGEKGGVLSGVVVRRAWGRAREAVHAPEECASPLGRRVYDCRHTCLTGWLNAGVPPAQVAEWAVNSVPVLLATYARVISGQAADIQRRIESLVDVSSYYPAG
ncbi:hypothetical protein [Peterkaempfera sp. SMS 1(5)a]|uniref:hypothetical protein n=1 Tax=Peterkaempfera podocarpi TaxID=3232308 RepID=UPI00366CE24C